MGKKLTSEEINTICMLLDAEYNPVGYFVTPEKTEIVNGIMFYDRGKYYDEDLQEIDFQQAANLAMNYAIMRG